MQEIHPNPSGNGKSVTDFFSTNFGLTDKQSIALMGVHALGHTNERISGFRHYAWAPLTSKKALNNEYYKNMITTEFVIENNKVLERKVPSLYRKYKEKSRTCDPAVSSFVGDEMGQAQEVDWIVRWQGQNGDNGPFNWNPLSRKCDQRKCDELAEKHGATPGDYTNSTVFVSLVSIYMFI